METIYMGETELTIEEILDKMQLSYQGDIVEGFILKIWFLKDKDNGNVYEYKEIEETYEHRLNRAIQELRTKLMDGTITAEEKEMLKLLVG